MHADEIQAFSDFWRIEDWLRSRECQSPWDNANGEKVSLIFFSYGSNHPGDPILCDLLASAAFEIHREALDEVSISKCPGCPVAGLLVFAQNRLVHQVIAEHCRTAFADTCNGFPKPCLCHPASISLQIVIPLRHLRFVITTQSGDIQVKTGSLGHGEQARELI